MNSARLSAGNLIEPPTVLVTIPHSPAAKAAVEVVQKLRNAGHAAFLVGGCVRDLVLGLQPKDYDVATQAKPRQVKAAVGKVIEVGAAFGVLVVPIRVDGRRIEIEVATFRAESDYSDGRRPDQVRFTDAREDVLRRDFTINGLLLAPQDDRWVVADFVGGIDDLAARRLRAIGEPLQRFTEDHLRVLRMVRFATRFDFEIEPSTMTAALECASKLSRISRERVREELVRMLLGPQPERAIKLLSQLKIGALLWSGLLTADSLGKRADRFVAARTALGEAAIADTVQVDYRPLSQLDESFALALLFDSEQRINPANPAAQLGEQLRLSKPTTTSIANTWRLAARLRARLVGSDLIRALRDPLADRALVLLVATQEAEPLWPQLRARRLAATKQGWEPELVVDGAALKAAGHRPSPRFKEALKAAEDVQLEGGTSEQAWRAANEALSED